MGNDLYIKGKSNTLPSLVMLHGLFGSLSNFEPIIPFITKETDVWVPEIPLYQTNMGNNPIHDLSQWLDEWLMEKELDSVILVGNSLGGQIALDYARKSNSNLKGLVLVGSSGLMPSEFGDTRPRRYDREYIETKTAEVFYTLPVQPSMVDEIYAILADRSQLSQLVRLAKASKNTLMDAYLTQIQIPSLIIWGDNDQITPPEIAFKFESLLPNAQLRWISDCGHVPMMEQPQAFASLLNDFIHGDFFNSPNGVFESSDDFKSIL
jgi:pimeloyl-ACP methyl ester carboxylesterase